MAYSVISGLSALCYLMLVAVLQTFSALSELNYMKLAEKQMKGKIGNFK